MTILATVVVLGVLIFVHELGHFWAAKAVGVEVQRFSIGLGPVLASFKRGETEYALSAIPLGGYVKMGGMDDEVMERLEGGETDGPRREPSERDFDAKPIWARTLVISAGVIMNMAFAFAVYALLAFQYGVPEVSTPRVGFIEASTLPEGTEALGEVELGSRVVAVGGVAVDTWTDVRRALAEAPAGQLTIQLSDPSRTLRIQVPDSDEDRVALLGSLAGWIDSGIGTTTRGSPAEEGGLEAGDLILAIDGEPTLNWYTLVAEIRSRPGETVDLTIRRGEDEFVRPVTLESVEERQLDGSTLLVGQVGIGRPDVRRVGPLEAAAVGYEETVAVTGLILGFLRDLVTGNVSPRNVGSIVTIGQASGQAAAAGIDTFLRFMALFSVNLAVLNLLPIPVLDGGHLVFLTIEAVRGGRALSVEQRLRWSNVGFLIIVGIMLWALSNDFLRLLGL